MKSVLMVAFHYPPEGASSGVLRTLKFSRYLPSHGWSPHVLTLRESAYTDRDDALRGQIPAEVTVHRAAGWDTTRDFAIRGRYLQCMAVPDDAISWLPFGVVKGLRVIRKTGIDVLFSTSPKPTAHLIAGSLKRLTGLPWIADFRDPWIEDAVPRPGSLRRYVESRMERSVVTAADVLTVTTPELGAELLRRHPYLPADKVSVIYNGYDEDDFPPLTESPAPPPSFEILHAGLVTPDYRDPVPLLRAVATLVATGDIPSDDVRLVFLGANQYLRGPVFQGAVKELGLSSVVRVADRIGHAEALRRFYAAAVLLVLQGGDTESLIPAKVFEYLRVGRPILALTSEGATARLLTDLNGGVIADPESVEDIATALRRLYAEWRREPDRLRARHIERFSRKALAGELAALLDRRTSGAALSGVR